MFLPGLAKRLYLIAALLALSVGGSALAASVSFTSVGAFTAAGSDISTGVSLIASSQGSSVTASYLPTVGYFSTGPIPAIGSSERFSIGTLSISPFSFLNTPLGFNSGDQFTVTLTEVDPFAPNSKSVAGTIDGSLTFSQTTGPNGVDTGSFTFNFLPNNSVVITALDGRKFIYSLENTTIDVNTNVSLLGAAPSTGTLYLDVTELDPGATTSTPVGAPLPGTAVMGLVLLSLCGVFGLNARLNSRRRAIAAA